MHARDEADIEKWLVWETRALPMPDGARHAQREMRLVWAAFDALKRNFNYTEETLVALCLDEARLQGKTFVEIFAPAIAWLDRELCRIHKIKD